MNKRVKAEAKALLDYKGRGVAHPSWIDRAHKVLRAIIKEPTDKPTQLEVTFVKHAARETAWARQFAKECNYAEATKALARRDAWLNAALIVQDQNLPQSNVLLG